MEIWFVALLLKLVRMALVFLQLLNVHLQKYVTTTLVKNVVEKVKHVSKDTILEYVVKMAKLDVAVTMDTHLEDVNAGNITILYTPKYQEILLNNVAVIMETLFAIQAKLAAEILTEI